MSRLRPAWFAVPAILIAGWMRIHNVYTYPADWGFDASFNWQYIIAVLRTGELPPPDAGWSTSDPPLYFFLSAGLLRLDPGRLILVPLLNVALGFGVAALAFLLVKRLAPDDELRAWVAGGLVLFLPAHAHMSAMVNEEMLAALCTSLALYAVARPGALERSGSLAFAGVACGAALLTKLSGIMVGGAVIGALALETGRRRAWYEGLSRIAGVGLLVVAVGGWFYLRNRWLYGYFQPFGLPAHQAMFELPPGSRGIADYLRFPLAVFTDAQLLNRDLLHSVWGSTYASVWFDAHRFFLPTASDGVRRLGTLLTLLGLVPTAAFATGLARGARRWWRAETTTDAPLLLLVVLTLAGYAVYTWQNPWFVILKGTTLLGLCLPFAVYTSEVMCDWGRRSRVAAIGLAGFGVTLAVAVTISCTFNGLFERTEVSGMRAEESWTP